MFREFAIHRFQNQQFVIKATPTDFETLPDIVQKTHPEAFSHYKYHPFIVVDKQGQKLTPSTVLPEQELVIFDHTGEDVSIVSLSTKKETDGYAPKEHNSTLKIIDEETYKKLTPSFQQKYARIEGETVIIETPVEDIGRASYPMAFDVERYLGDKPNILQRHARKIEASNRSYSLYSRRDPDYTGFRNFRKTQLSTELVLRVLEELYTERDEKRQGKQHHAKFFISSYDVSDSYILIQYFEEPWDGEHEKRLSRKKNGGVYADRRGTYHPKYPKTASTVTINASDISLLQWSEVTSDEEQLAEIDTLYDALFNIG